MKLGKKQTIFLGIALAVSLSLAACAGFDWGDVVQTNVPSNVQGTHSLPAKMSLNESQVRYREWFGETQSTGLRWKNEIERANHVKTMLDGLTLHALAEVGPTIAGFPVLSGLLPFLTALVGIGIRRPGDVTKDELAKQKEAAYNKALKEGAKLSSTSA